MTKRGRFMGSWLDGRTVSIATSKPDAPDDDRGEYEVNGCDQLSDVLMPQPSAGTEEAAQSDVLTYTYGNTKLEPQGADDVVE